ncbi:MAG TPA: amino acid adenylation domain-containing protein, partial [Pseudoxanthomonas sp.]
FADEVPVLDLPTDRPRPAQRSFASCRIDHVIDADLAAAIRRMGARRGISLFATLLAGFSGLLSRLTGQSRVVVGIPAAGQSIGGHADLIGHCVNTLPLRFDLDAAQPFTHALDEAQATVLDAFEHQRYTFGTLLGKLRIKRDPSRMPLVSVLFNIDRALDKEDGVFPGLVLEVKDNPRSFDMFELFLNVAQVRDELRVECQYNRDLFDDATVRRWLAAYEALFRAAVDSPAASFASLSLLDRPALAELETLQPPAVPFDRECRMHENFEAQCDAAPGRIAVRCGDAVASYAQLEARANRIAHLLRSKGVHHGSLVGLAVDRSIDMLAALLGILKAGAGYVPLDPQFPADRLAYMAGDAGLAALVTQARHASQFDLRGRPVLALDQLDDALGALPDTRIGRDAFAASPESIAYVIYTSGSTGRPKGVQVPHRAVTNFLVGMRHEPGLRADDRLLAVTTLSFDIAVLELLLPLSVGALVVLADRETAGDAHALAALLAERRCTVMQATPATWRLLLDSGWNGSEGFKALCGGEPLAPDLAAQLLPRCESLWNLYGPTETTVWSTCMRVETPVAGQVPDIHIGGPIANTRIWILDAQGEPCPRGVPGEICIGGEGVTLGYLGRPELTADRFLPDRFAPPHVPASGLPAPLLYRTGDRGRWRPDGNLEHMGRLDFQVKIRGYRIELGEVENTLASHPSVARVVALAREDRPGDVRLVVYVVARPGETVVAAALTDHLRGHLPDYMIPQHIVALDSIPLLPNGKIDRKSLPQPVPGQAQAKPVVPRAHEAEAVEDSRISYLIGIWTEMLGAEAGPADNFFDLGGHSMLAVQMANRVARETGVRVRLLPLATQTLSQIAAELPATSPGAAGRTATDAAPAQAHPQPFFFGTASRQLFGIHHPAATGTAKACVLFCPPLLHEQMRSYRYFSQLAKYLAEKGIACTRFDYFGTGDSGGDDHQFSPAAADADIAWAAEEARKRAGDVPLILLGIRGSALFAVRQAAKVGASSLWLWQPVVDGHEYASYLQSRDLAERHSSSRYHWKRKVPTGPHDLMGFRLSGDFLPELAVMAIEPASLDLPIAVLAADHDTAADAFATRRYSLPDRATEWADETSQDSLMQMRDAHPALESLLADLPLWTSPSKASPWKK